MQPESLSEDDGAFDGALRFFESDGETWVVREVGQTRSGTGSDSGAPLLLLEFARSIDPEKPLRKNLAVATSLDALGDEELGELLQRSRPVS
jgi:hypothetical protein